MSLILHLGVVDVPEPEGNTTFGVANILEAQYGLFSMFAQSSMDRITEHITGSVAGALENLTLGQMPSDVFAAANGEIEQDFRHFLDMEDMAKLGVPGVPTQAALDGKSVRFKRRRGPRRPSFIDSGVLQKSFRVWVD